MSEIKEYDSLIAKITWDNRGFFVMKLKDSRAIYDDSETENQFNFLNQQSAGKPYRIIMDTRGSLIFPTDGAHQYFMKNANYKNIIAIVMNSLPMQLMLGQTLKRDKIPNYKAFKTEDAAVEWILTQKI